MTIISIGLYKALMMAAIVSEECKPEGPTTLALELADKHRPLLDSITDEEIIKLGALVQALERGKLFKAAQEAQQAAPGPSQPLDTPPAVEATPRATKAP
jgi:hypothetical protein